MPTTPNMNLQLPTPSVTPGPTYATENNQAFDVVDAHDHTSGKGVAIPSAALNINADLPFNAHNATELRSARFEDNGAALSTGTDINCAYVTNGDLYFNNSSGVQIQLTAAGGLNAASIGAIGGDYGTSTASLYYSSPADTFYFTSNTNIPANIDAGSVIFREVTTSPNGIEISSPSGLAAGYTITLPAALPGSTKVLSVSSSGVLATGVAGTVDANDLATNAVTTSKILDLNVTTGKLADDAVETVKIKDLNVTTGKLADGAVTQVKRTANIVTSAAGGLVSYTFPSAPGAQVTVTNLSVTITTVGKPVRLSIISDGSGNASFTRNTSASGSFNIYFYRGVTQIARYQHNLPQNVTMPTSAYNMIDTPAAGTYTYTVQVQGASITIDFTNCKLVAQEMA